ncbi:hypothetical protein V9T40_004978 [Parthenolecanium corni]|uniref:Uncharacterized protein n=1 Tax=Parthenolecanium corni TaxID=536013 RepID=A0AAN9TDA7_9HEMI
MIKNTHYIYIFVSLIVCQTRQGKNQITCAPAFSVAMATATQLQQPQQKQPQRLANAAPVKAAPATVDPLSARLPESLTKGVQ